MVRNSSTRTLWDRILFSPDKKLQVEELLEVQDLTREKIASLFNFIYPFYSIIVPFKITPLNIPLLITDPLNLEVSSGIIFSTLFNSNTFIKVLNPTFLEVSSEEDSTIGILIEEDILEGNLNYDFYGDLGSPYREVKGIITTNNPNSLPIAVIRPNYPNPPTIYYWDNIEEFNLSIESQLNSKPITSLIETRTEEVDGTYIAKGLELSFLTRNDSLTINPGLAYILGKRIELSYPTYIELDLTLISPSTFKVITITLEYSGLINSYISNNSFPALIPPNSLSLGNIFITENNIEIIPSQERTTYSLTLTSLKNRLLSIQQETAQLRLLLDNLDPLYRNTINSLGTIADSFNDLDNTDINNPFYSVTISNNKVTLPKTTDVINITNLIIENVFSTTKYISPRFSTRTLIEQAVPTSIINLNPNNIPTLSIDPPKLIPGATKLTLTASNFNPLEDNLLLTFNEVGITDFTTTNRGSSNFSLKAALDGSLVVSFFIPSNLENRPYVVSLRNANVIASIIFNPATSIPSLINSSSSIAQSFTLLSPSTIEKVGIKVRRAPSIASSPVPSLTAFKFFISPLVNNIPSNEILGEGTFTFNNINTSSNGTNYSEASLDFPTALLPGEYALIITSPLPNSELFIGEVNKPSLLNNSPSIEQGYLNGALYTFNEIWIKENNKDLCFKLIEALPSSLNLEAKALIEKSSDLISYSLSTIIPPSTSIELLREESSRKIPLENNTFLNENLPNIPLIFKFISSPNFFPIIKLDSFFTLESYLLEGTYITKVFSLPNFYKECYVTIDQYLPSGSSIRVYISPDENKSFIELPSSPTSLKIVDGNIPLNALTYSISNLNTPSNKLSIRIDLKTTSSKIVPYFTNLRIVAF